MTSRRQFLGVTAVAVAGMPVLAGATRVLEGTRAFSTRRSGIEAFLVDERLFGARALSARLGTTGATVHALPRADLTHIWLQHIEPAWKRAPIPVAGLTARPALFCLEQLAFGHGLRVVFHGEHILHPDGHTEHVLLRGGELAQISAPDLVGAGSSWPARLASALADYRADPRSPRFGPSQAALAPAVPRGAQLLTSWIIAA